MPGTPRTRFLALALVAFAAAFAAAVLVDRGDEEAASPPDPPAASESPAGAEPPDESRRERAHPGREPAPAGEEAAGEAEEGPSGPPPESTDELAAARAVHGYVRALAERDGARVCATFAEGALGEVGFPAEGPDCATSVERSLGFRDPRGLPVWRRSRLSGPISAQIDGDAARVTATVVTRYADDRKPSVEDDVVYLRRAGEGWLLAKPSATFFRAIGIADVPPSVLAPP